MALKPGVLPIEPNKLAPNAKAPYNAHVQYHFIFRLLTFLCLFVGHSTFGAPTDLDEALKALQSAKGFKASVSRTIQLAILDSTKNETGELTVSGQNIRLEIAQPTKSLMVLNGKDLWLEVQPDPEFGGELQVSRGRLNKSKDSQIFSSLLGGTSWKTHFSLKDTIVEGGRTKFVLVPKKDLPDFKLVKIVTDKESKKLESLEYTDELNNITTYNFTKIEILKSVSNKMFQYKPPKSVKVMELN